MLCINVSQSIDSNSIYSTSASSMPLIFSTNGAMGSTIVFGGVILAYNTAINPLISVQNTYGILFLITVNFTNNYDSEALYAYNVAFINGSDVNCYQNNYRSLTINPNGGCCLNLRNIIATLMDHLTVIECKSLNTSAGIKIYNDDSINQVYLSQKTTTFLALQEVTSITNAKFVSNYANYSVFNEIGAAIYIDSIFPLSINFCLFQVFLLY